MDKFDRQQNIYNNHQFVIFSLAMISMAIPQSTCYRETNNRMSQTIEHRCGPLIVGSGAAGLSLALKWL